MKNNQKLKGKDLINIGIYAAIYCVLMTCISMLGYIPIMMPMLTVIVPIILGVPMMLFYTKVKKFGMITIMATIVGIYLCVTGMGFWPILFGVVFGFLADLIAKSGSYASGKKSIFSYGTFCVLLFGNYLPLQGAAEKALCQGGHRLMARGILQASIQNRGLVLDPRTKLVILFDIALFVLGSAGGGSVEPLVPILCAMPAVLMLSAKKWKGAATYLLVYLLSWLTYTQLVPLTKGAVNFILLGCSGMLSRFLPGIAMGCYLVSTTTVSEFTAAMLRLHLSEKIIIPLSVMFRFFPTVMDEAVSINAAMRMRGIYMGGKNVGKMLEYRLVPLMTCCVKIGEELSAAALTRGLGGEVKRTNICKIGFHIQDYLLFVVCLIPYAVWIMGRVL